MTYGEDWVGSLVNAAGSVLGTWVKGESDEKVAETALETARVRASAVTPAAAPTDYGRYLPYAIGGVVILAALGIVTMRR
jgi:hypothetical protein